MELRKTVKRPKRYDPDASEIPDDDKQYTPTKNNSAVRSKSRPTSLKYNPDLPPAAFPTLDLSRNHVSESHQSTNPPQPSSTSSTPEAIQIRQQSTGQSSDMPRVSSTRSLQRQNYGGQVQQHSECDDHSKANNGPRNGTYMKNLQLMGKLYKRKEMEWNMQEMETSDEDESSTSVKQVGKTVQQRNVLRQDGWDGLAAVHQLDVVDSLTQQSSSREEAMDCLYLDDRQRRELDEQYILRQNQVVSEDANIQSLQDEVTRFLLHEGSGLPANLTQEAYRRMFNNYLGNHVGSDVEDYTISTSSELCRAQSFLEPILDPVHLNEWRSLDEIRITPETFEHNLGGLHLSAARAKEMPLSSSYVEHGVAIPAIKNASIAQDKPKEEDERTVKDETVSRAKSVAVEEPTTLVKKKRTLSSYAPLLADHDLSNPVDRLDGGYTSSASTDQPRTSSGNFPNAKTGFVRDPNFPNGFSFVASQQTTHSNNKTCSSEDNSHRLDAAQNNDSPKPISQVTSLIRATKPWYPGAVEITVDRGTQALLEHTSSQRVSEVSTVKSSSIMSTWTNIPQVIDVENPNGAATPSDNNLAKETSSFANEVGSVTKEQSKKKRPYKKKSGLLVKAITEELGLKEAESTVENLDVVSRSTDKDGQEPPKKKRSYTKRKTGTFVKPDMIVPSETVKGEEGSAEVAADVTRTGLPETVEETITTDASDSVGQQVPEKRRISMRDNDGPVSSRVVSVPTIKASKGHVSDLSTANGKGAETQPGTRRTSGKLPVSKDPNMPSNPVYRGTARSVDNSSGKVINPRKKRISTTSSPSISAVTRLSNLEAGKKGKR